MSRASVALAQLIRCSAPARAFARSSTFMSTRDVREFQALRTWSPWCWPRGAVPESGNPGVCRLRRPFLSKPLDLVQGASVAVSSSATSMRMAKAVASVKCAVLAPLRATRRPSVHSAMASFQRSRKRWRRCCSPVGNQRRWPGAASARSCSRWPCSMAARRAPSRLRAGQQSFSASSRQGRLPGRLQLCRHWLLRRRPAAAPRPRPTGGLPVARPRRCPGRHPGAAAAGRLGHAPRALGASSIYARGFDLAALELSEPAIPAAPAQTGESSGQLERAGPGSGC